MWHFIRHILWHAWHENGKATVACRLTFSWRMPWDNAESGCTMLCGNGLAQNAWQERKSIKCLADDDPSCSNQLCIYAVHTCPHYNGYKIHAQQWQSFNNHVINTMAAGPLVSWRSGYDLYNLIHPIWYGQTQNVGVPQNLWDAFKNHSLDKWIPTHYKSHLF